MRKKTGKEAVSAPTENEVNDGVYISILIQGRNTFIPFYTTSPSILLTLGWATWLWSLRQYKPVILRTKQTQKTHSRVDAKGCCGDKTVTRLLEKPWTNAACASGPQHQIFHSYKPTPAGHRYLLTGTKLYHIEPQKKPKQHKMWYELKKQFCIAALMSNNSQAAALSGRSTSMIKCKGYFFI